MKYTYTVETTSSFDKAFRKLDKHIMKDIKGFIDTKLNDCENPRIHGEKLEVIGKWRYRIGDYRLICNIDDDRRIILAVLVGHRKCVYEVLKRKKSV